MFRAPETQWKTLGQSGNVGFLWRYFGHFTSSATPNHPTDKTPLSLPLSLPFSHSPNSLPLSLCMCELEKRKKRQQLGEVAVKELAGDCEHLEARETWREPLGTLQVKLQSLLPLFSRERAPKEVSQKSRVSFLGFLLGSKVLENIKMEFSYILGAFFMKMKRSHISLFCKSTSKRGTSTLFFPLWSKNQHKRLE